MIPQNLVEEAKSYLTKFKGQIATYDPSQQNLRKAVISTLNERYPDTWHICDAQGKLLGGEELKNSETGYRENTCLKKKDGDVLCLITNEGLKEQDRQVTMREYTERSKRVLLRQLEQEMKKQNLQKKKLQSGCIQAALL